MDYVQTAIILSIEEYNQLMEDLHDLTIIAERKDEEEIAPRKSLMEFAGIWNLTEDEENIVKKRIKELKCSRFTITEQPINSVI